MFNYGFWFYHELQDKIGTPPLKPNGDSGEGHVCLDTPTGTYLVKCCSFRMELFRQNPKCVNCDRIGSLWILQSHHEKEYPHLNLYHVGEQVEGWEKASVDGLVLMTKDHITPRSKGGLNVMSNLQIMCTICNCIKGNEMPHTKELELKNASQKSSVGPSGNRSLSQIGYSIAETIY